MYPNATNLTGVNSTVQFFRVADGASSGMFGTATSLAIYLLLYIGAYSVSRGNSQKALVGASFASFIVNLMLVNAGLLNTFVAAVPLIIFGLSLFVK